MLVVLLTRTAGCTVPSRAWTQVTFDDLFRFRSPVPLTRTGAQGIDTRVAQWEGPGLKVLVDHGMFSDPLTSHAGVPGHRVFDESVDGQPARIVSAAKPDGGRMAAVHFADLGARARGGPTKLTMVVEAEGLDEEILLEMVRSITFAERGAASSDSS